MHRAGVLPKDVSPTSSLSMSQPNTSLPRAASSHSPYFLHLTPVSPLFRRETSGSEESPGALPPAWEAPLPSRRNLLLPPQTAVCGSVLVLGRRSLTLGVLSWVQSPLHRAERWISQAKRAGHSP